MQSCKKKNSGSPIYDINMENFHNVATLKDKKFLEPFLFKNPTLA